MLLLGFLSIFSAISKLLAQGKPDLLHLKEKIIKISEPIWLVPRQQFLRPPQTVLRWQGGSREASLDFQFSYCSRYCVNDTKLQVVDSFSTCLSAKCLECSCEKPQCYLYNLCCPDKPDKDHLETDTISQDQRNKKSTEDASTSNPVFVDLPPEDSQSKVLERDSLHLQTPVCDDDVLFIRSCPSGYQDEEVRRKCEQNPKASESVHFDLEAIAHVTHPEMSLSFYNAYCAECNGFKKVNVLHLVSFSRIRTLSLVFIRK